MKQANSFQAEDTVVMQTATGQLFLQVFNLLINSASTHTENNQSVLFAAGQFIGLLRQLFRDSEDVTLLFDKEGFYLQDEKIVCAKATSPFAQAMNEFFEQRRNLEGLRFHESMLEAPLEEVTSFARLLTQSSLHDDPAVWLEMALAHKTSGWIDTVSASPPSLPEQDKNTAGKMKPPGADTVGESELICTHNVSEEISENKRRNAIRTYGFALLALKDIARKIGSNKVASIKKIIHIVQNMIDMVADDNQLFLSLSTIRDHEDYTFTHSINVAILSIGLGYKIGLPRSVLETLGLSALFHDLGKVDIPHAIFNKPEKLTEPEFQVIRQHSMDSVRRIIKLKTSRRKKMSILLPPFEHHLKYDLSGYPKTPRNKPVSLLGRVITIADVFDAITAPRVYRPSAISPDCALGYMLEKSGKDFDPILLKAFINMIGVYPIGTLLRFEQDELGLVAGYCEKDGNGRELIVRMLKRSDNKEFLKGDLVSLGVLNIKSRTFDRPVLESKHPVDFGIQPARFII